jgi:hypothetical protein
MGRWLRFESELEMREKLKDYSSIIYIICAVVVGYSWLRGSKETRIENNIITVLEFILLTAIIFIEWEGIVKFFRKNK